MRHARLLVLSVLYLATPAAPAQDSLPRTGEGDPSTFDVISAIRDEVVDSDRIVNEFESLAGSHENAQNLVVGLRNAKLVRITMATAPTHSEEISFMPPTRPMSFSDIHQALSLAQARLRSKHIDKPTPAQIKASLAGGALPNADGETTNVIGILPLRRRGMSWDQIARILRLTGPKPVAALQAAADRG